MLVLAAPAAPASAQAGAGERWEWSIGVTTSTPLLADGNGTRVRPSVAPVVGARLALMAPAAEGVDAGVTIRGMAGALRIRDGKERWGGGTLWQVDVMADVTWRPGRARVGGALGATWLRSGSGISPLERPRIAPAGEVRMGLRPSTTSRWSGSLTLQGYRMGVPGGSTGGVMRAIVGVSRAF